MTMYRRGELNLAAQQDSNTKTKGIQLSFGPTQRACSFCPNSHSMYLDIAISFSEMTLTF